MHFPKCVAPSSKPHLPIPSPGWTPSPCGRGLGRGSYFLCNNNEITTNTVDPTSISVEIALTSGVTPNLIIE